MKIVFIVLCVLSAVIALYACYDYDSGEISLYPRDPRVSGGEPYAGYLCTCMYQPPVIIDLNLPPGMYDVSLYQYLSSQNWSTMVVAVGNDSVAVPDLGSGGPLWTNQIGSCGYNCGPLQFTAYEGNADVRIHGTGYNLYLLRARIRGNIRPVVTAVSPSGGTVSNPITLNCTSYDPGGVVREEYEYQILGETVWHIIGVDNTPNTPYIWNSGMDGITIRIRARAYDDHQCSEWFVGDWFTIVSTPPTACYDYDSGEIDLLTDPRVTGGELYMGYRLTCAYQPPIQVDLNLPPGRYDISFLEYNSPESWSTRYVVVGADTVSIPDLGSGGPRWYYNVGTCGENCGSWIFENTLASGDIIIKGTGFNVYLLKMRVRGNIMPVVSSVSPSNGEYKDPLELTATVSDPGGVNQIEYQYQLEGTSEFVGIGTDNSPSTPFDWTTGLTNARIRLRTRAQDNCGLWSNWYIGGYFIVDNLPPTTTDNIPDGWQNTSITVVLTRDDGPLGSGFDRNGRTYYSIDGSDPTNIGTTFTLTESGIYTIRYYSVDDVGNIEPVHTRNAYIDKIPPSFGPWSVPDIADTNSGGVNISIVVTDALSGVNLGSTRLQYGIGTSSTLSTPDIISWTDFATGTTGTLTLNWRTYANRYLYLRCIALDNAGNSAVSPIYVEHIQIINRAPVCYEIPDQEIYEKINCGEDCEFIPGAIGYYYNLPANHPEVEGPITGVVRGDNPFNHDWYSPRYFVFSRLDRSLNFGDSWWPVNTGLPGDPQYFAVHWVTYLYAPETRTYSFQIISDDDAWAYIDGRLVADNGGIHPMTSCYWNTTLTKGFHTLHIYFAERHRVQSGFVFNAPGLMYGVFPEECASVGLPTEFTCINLDDYVTDDSPDANIRWSVTNGTNIRVTIDRDRRACFTVLDDNWSGSETFTFRATDPAGLYCTETVTLTVHPRNDCPYITTPIADQTIYEGGSFTNINLCGRAVDPDNAEDELVWSTSGGTNIIVTITGCVATVNYLDPEWNGTESIWFIVKDPEGAADSQLVSFTVLPVNDPPVVSRIPDQTINEGETFAEINLDDYVTDPDNSVAEITWAIEGARDLIVTMVGNIVRIEPPDSEYSGSERIRFIATDPGGLSSFTEATFTVNPVNDPPIVSTIPGQIISEGAAFAPINLDDYAFDIDNPVASLTWSVVGAENLIVHIIDRIAYITVADSEWNGSEVLRFVATDPGGLSGSSEATFTVLPVNDPPIITPPLPDLRFWAEETPEIDLSEYVVDVDNSIDELIWSIDPLTELIGYTLEGTRLTFAALDGHCDVFGSFVVTVTDPYGATDKDTIEVFVRCSNPVATITAAVDTITWGSSFTFCVNVNDELTGNSDIVYVEYFIDELGEPGTGIPFVITEPSPNLTVCVTIDTRTLSPRKHRLWARGRDAFGSWSNVAWKDIIVIDITPPPNPAHLDASACGRDVTLVWDHVIAPDLKGYNIYRRYSGEATYTRITDEPIATNYYYDLGLPFDTTFYYVVTAVDTFGNESGFSNEDSAYTYEVKVENFGFRLLGNAKVRFYWSTSPEDSIYYIYYAEGDGPIDYSIPVAVIYAPDSTWQTPPHMLEAYHSYSFAIRVLAKCGYMDQSEATIINVTPLPNPNAVECEKVFIKIPKPGKRIDGNSVLVMAETNCDPSGGPSGIGDRYANISAVLFQYRLHGTSEWINFPPETHWSASPEHGANPDTTPPFFIHWDVTVLDEGIYDIRAVAYNRAGVPDPTPSYITVIIDHHHPDYIESISIAGRKKGSAEYKHLTTLKPYTPYEIILAGTNGTNYTKVAIPPVGITSPTRAEFAMGTPSLNMSGFAPRSDIILVSFKNNGNKLTDGARMTIEIILTGKSMFGNDELGLYRYNEQTGSFERLTEFNINNVENKIQGYSSSGGYFALLAKAEKELPTKPESYFLGKNYPNPFNAATSISFAVPKETDVAIEIYNIIGIKIRTLVNRKLDAGTYSIIWDGKADNGEELPTGIYFYIMRTPEYRQTERMLLIK